MNFSLNTFLFGLYPYIALVVCVVACFIRFDREQYTWKAGSSQLLRTKNMVLASNLFHIGIIFILFGHIVGLLTPESLYHYVISTPNKQLLAMISGGFFGLLCLVGLIMLLHRRLTDPRVRASSSFSDIAVLVLLLIQLLLGLMTIFISAEHLDGSVMLLLANWAQSIVTFQPMQAAASIANVHILYKLHVFFGISIILVFPFTRLVHMISAPVWYLGRNYQIVRQKRT
ncbi:MAG: respiratory nitrate reductase subunit gamma [Gammaproteobacteria bacterium]|nr:respiratory nitrate reductase subunit gamma [Gammaproteobacteria bacterium]MBT8150376.1 respiratory nitrate reductase subunit gamma [Gammaproteobacteria bacterium]NND40174.1 respiratory nitrate reductase subunit gamma [Pseudomonadales bacterium]NNM11424.1 respiratory nitrate reductase subunit gamma [Pseudomonadales bacterium]RZV54210.1 MAG: respiratory nitrate reductase subunit gamma [Pseudomonadales bacterium]